MSTRQEQHIIDRYIEMVVDRFGRELVGFFCGVFVAGFISLAFFSFRHFSQTPITITTPEQESITPLISEAVQNSMEAGHGSPEAVVEEEVLAEVSGKININTASSAELDTLPGIGPALAQRIIENRPFNTIFEIQKVPGIGVKKYQQLQEMIAVE